jgi:hypothetical protein
VDEKSQIQTLDHTQPGLPLKKGRAATITHDHKRNGTTTLFAALNVKTDELIGQCLPQHLGNVFVRFIRAPNAIQPFAALGRKQPRYFIRRPIPTPNWRSCFSITFSASRWTPRSTAPDE